MTEIWLAIPGFQNHQVSNLGRLYSMPNLVDRGDCLYSKPGRMIKQFVSKKGYLRASILGKSYSVHSLVASAFIGPRPEGMQVDHIDGNKTNNQVDNLEYVTSKENVRRAMNLGHFAAKGQPPGEGHWNARLSDSQVANLRHLRAEGMSVKNIAAHFGVHPGYVYSVLSGLKRKTITYG